jgi:hypothetical protein
VLASLDRLSCAESIIGGSLKDVDLWNTTTVDGKFRLRVVAKHLLKDLSRSGIEHGSGEELAQQLLEGHPSLPAWPPP